MHNLIASSKLRNNPTARRLLEHLEACQTSLGIEDTYVYFEFPIYQDYEEEVFRPSFLLLSAAYGIILVKTLTSVDANDLRDADELLSQVHSLVLSKLLKSRILRLRAGELKFGVLPILFVDSPRFQEESAEELESTIITSLQSLNDLILECKKIPFSNDIINEARSILEGTKGLLKGNARMVPEGDTTSKLAILAELEGEIVNLDEMQRKAAISLIEGPQRIRGLAGSGKTVVLAMKAAQLHLDNPEANILVTYNTKSLYDTIKGLVTRFYRQSADRDPDWDKLNIMHGWGGAQRDGVYYKAAKRAGVKPLGVRNVGSVDDKLDYVCSQLLSTGRVTAAYDHVLIDEAQDFGNSFFRLCLALTKGEGDFRSIVWAYDELQSIFNVQTRAPEELFGRRKDGAPEVDLERAARSVELPRYMSNDLVLHKCYRNAKEVLVCAHALGFALYASTPVQMLQNRSHWEDVGYRVISGDFTVGSPTDLLRPTENSPLSISDKQVIGDLIQYFIADGFDSEIDWVARGIQEFLAEGLSAEDILVISMDDKNATSYFAALTKSLGKCGVASNNLKLLSMDDTSFKVSGEATLSTVYYAKGNEAPVVFVLGLDAVFPQKDLRLGRNKIFTAMTRSKAWVRLSGFARAKVFFDELDEAISNCPHLRFIYPDPKTVKTLQRDLSNRSDKLRKLMLQLEQVGATEDEIEALLETVKKAPSS